jgi:hypothetical protein
MEMAITSFFQKKGITVEIEPHGSRGPDIEGKNGVRLVGEIKHKREIERDLKGYWSQWNSRSSFGGKTAEYKLRSEFPQDVKDLGRDVKGWLATIFGQLRNYTKKANLNDGWLVVESIHEFDHDIMDAINYLIKNKLIKKYTKEISHNIGYYHISYN